MAPKTIPKPPVGNSLSFLFVVNSLLISERAHIEADRYGIFPPPSYPNAYSEELPSPVFRYQDGRVTQLPANLYFWGREPGADGSYASGRIWGYSTDPFTNEYRAEKLTEYSTYTVFRGWHFQPVMFMGCDALTMNVDEEEMMTSMRPCLVRLVHQPRCIVLVLESQGPPGLGHKDLLPFYTYRLHSVPSAQLWSRRSRKHGHQPCQRER